MSLVTPMTNEITLSRGGMRSCNSFIHEGGWGAPRYRFRWGEKEKGRYHAVGLDKQKVVLLWTLADERGRGKKHARYKAG